MAIEKSFSAARGLEKHVIGVNQFCNLLELDPARFVGVQVMKHGKVIWIFLEPRHALDDQGICDDSH